MMLFGSVMNELMELVIKSSPTFAEQEIDKLESMNWHQYLTKIEAEKICDSITPSYAWNFNDWEKALNSFELEIEREPYFNKYALWVVMNYIYKINSGTISVKILENKMEEVTSEQMISVIHALSIDFLMEKDERLNVRKFFLNGL